MENNGSEGLPTTLREVEAVSHPIDLSSKKLREGGRYQAKGNRAKGYRAGKGRPFSLALRLFFLGYALSCTDASIAYSSTVQTWSTRTNSKNPGDITKASTFTPRMAAREWFDGTPE